MCLEEKNSFSIEIYVFVRDYCKAVSISSLGFVNTPFNPFTARVFDGVL